MCSGAAHGWVCVLEQWGAGAGPLAKERVRLGGLVDTEVGTEGFHLCSCLIKCRVQLPGVGSLEKLTIGVSGGGEQAAWLLEQVEVTDEASGGRGGLAWGLVWQQFRITSCAQYCRHLLGLLLSPRTLHDGFNSAPHSAGETAFFPCNAWLGRGKGTTERSLVGSRSNPREARLEAARLRQQVEAANKQLAEANAELAAARAAAGDAQQASSASQDALAAKLAALQAEVQQLQAALAAAQQRASAAEARVEALQGELQAAQERAAGLQKEWETSQQASAAGTARSMELAAQLGALQDELAHAQEAAAAAAAKAKRFEGEARRGEEQLQELRAQHERLQRDAAAQ